MKHQPILKTKRLILKPFTIEDSSRVTVLAGDKKIADVTANIPHPYPEGLANEWISTHSQKWNNHELAVFAISLADSDLLIGAISLDTEGELGYWVGVEFWNKGYCSEACRKMVDFGFNNLNLKHIHARHLSRNPASGKVLLNSGLIHVGSNKSVCGFRKESESTEHYEIKNK